MIKGNCFQNYFVFFSPETLSDTLKELRAEGIITRESFAEIPPRVEYSLANDGVELRKAVLRLLKWAATRNLARELLLLEDYINKNNGNL